MELTGAEITGFTQYAGGQLFEVAAGKTLKIETSPAGEDILSKVVPAGKKWEVHISVNIKETAV